MSTGKFSYLSANTFPIKIFLNRELIDNLLEKGLINSIHIQLIPTNRCNFKCDFCSCANKKDSEELSFDDYLKIIDNAKRCGCKAVTITGGGEPLMHPRIGEIIDDLRKRKIKIGLTTNGSLISRLNKRQLDSMTWIRVSGGDSMSKNLKRVGIRSEQYWKNLSEAVKKAPKVDWSFSYVYTDKPDLKLMKEYVRFANKNKFAHVRITPDILDLEHTRDISKIKMSIQRAKIDDSKVVYQERKSFEHGAKECYISLLKPLIGADGYIYPCCGTQYAKKNPTRDNDPKMRICKATEIDQFFKGKVPFDGSKCVKCYYNEYNILLKTIIEGVNHQEFV